MRMYPVEGAIRAQKALREAAGLGPEQFPVQAFVGMMSDEIEELRKRGRSDQEIARLIEAPALRSRLPRLRTTMRLPRIVTGKPENDFRTEVDRSPGTSCTVS